jgi:hypothetical protein
MLSFAGTKDLRVNMLKLSNFNHLNRCRALDFLAFMMMATCSLPVVADIKVSAPVGVHTIGQPIAVTSTVSGIPPEVSSQLRSTCLRGRVVSMESNSEFAPASEVTVNFQPTFAQGGLIEFKSTEPVNHALVQLELNSECPLLVFQQSWPLIMNQLEQGSDPGTRSRTEPASAATFDPASSSLLQASRRAPRMAPQIRQVTADASPQNPATAVLEVTANTQTESTEILALQPVADDSLKLASLDQSLINHGLIESEAISLGLDEHTAFENPPKQPKAMPFPRVESMVVLAVATSSLLVLGVVWFRSRLKRRSDLTVRIAPRAREPEQSRSQVAEFSDYSASDFTATGQTDFQHARFGSDRVLESLMGGDESLYANDLESGEVDSIFADPASGRSNALKTCVDMINRADVRSWDLPPSYQSLVSDRNKALEMHRTPEALILRCHIGLVELAYQEAGQGHAVELEASNELLQLLLGRHVYDLESNTTMGVPDVLKSHVKAKLCEIDGAENRQLLRENLLSLNTQIEHQALCFHTNAWREFLSEEGLPG